MRYVHREGKGGPKERRIQAAPFWDSLGDVDAKLYLELMERAIEEVMLPFGGDVGRALPGHAGCALRTDTKHRLKACATNL